MRLTADLIRGAPAYINPLKERELSLRGYKISKIENLGVTEDQYDVLDLSDNEILKLENFPLLQRLHAILLNNNRLCRISKGLGEFLPRLVTLILTGNKITNLEDIDNLAELPRLTHLSLLNNPISKQDHYRLYVIHKLPKLKLLDFRKVKPSERKEAEKKFGPSTVGGKPKENKMKSQAKTFVVGDGIPPPKKKGLIPEQRRKIMEAIKKATSLGEIERLEKILSSGKIPSDFELDPSLKESSQSTTQNGEKKEGESEKDSKDSKSTEKVDTESENKEKSTKNKDDTGDDDALADQEGDDEEDASRREIADAQVDIEMTE